MSFELTTQPINEADLCQSLILSSTGALVEFKGIVRDINQGKPVQFIEYEAYADMVYVQANRIISQTIDEFSIQNIGAVHRTGLLSIGEVAIWVGVTAMHRGDAFKACEHVMNRFKKDLPIWKKETYQDHHSEWVNCRCGQV